MAYAADIGLALATFAVAIISPGPNVMAILATSLSQGRKAGQAVGLGVATGSFIWASFTAVGLSAVLANYAAALTVIKILGGFYLAWLAVKSLRSAASNNKLDTSSHPGVDVEASRHYRRGLTIQMTNPKAVLAWIAIISIGLDENSPLWVAAVIVIATTTLSVIIHLVYARAFSTPRVINLYAKARRGIDATLGAFFGYAAYKLLTTRT